MSQPHRSAGLTALLLFAACGESVEPHPRLKLAEIATGELSLPADDQTPEILVDEDFAGGHDGWLTFENPAQPLARTGTLQVEDGSENGRAFVRLSGSRGALFQIVPVEPATTYRFEATLRTNGLVPADRPFYGARPWVTELSATGPPEELLKRLDTLGVKLHQFPSSIAAGDEEWHTRERLFRTRPETRSLLVACMLGAIEAVDSGSIDFADVRLERVSTRSFHEDLLARATEEFGRGEPTPTGWRARRRVRALVGAELRPAIALLPGERITFELPIPSGEAALELGVGPWRPALADALAANGARGLRFGVSVDGEPALALESEAPDALVEARWQDLELELSAHAGDTVRIELSVDGDLPGVFGAPALYDRTFVSDRPNLVLVSIDTLRADRLGSYGYPEHVSPRLDAFAAEAVRFERAVSQAPYTLPSHTSMFSGQFPSVHGIQRGGQVISSERTPLLARILSERGYRTQAYTGGGFLNADFGFDKGFDGFTVIDPLRHPESRYLAELSRRDPDRFSAELVAEFGTGRIHAFLDESRDQPFFLFLHTYTVHDYDPPPATQRCAERGCTYERTDWRQFRLAKRYGWNPQPATEADRDHLSHRYDDALLYVDGLLGDVLDRLEALGLAENTIVAITTDHGEELLERGFVQHGKTLYEEITHVPLLLRVPGVAPGVDSAPAMTIDLVPTLLARMGIPRDPRMQGLDLLAPDRDTNRQTWSEIDDAFVHKYTLRDGGWKLIHNPPDDSVVFPASVEWELYDLATDALERSDLSASERERFEELRAALEEHRAALEALGESYGAVGTGEIDQDTLLQLQELGYVE